MKLLISILVEAIVGISLAGFALAILVPVLNRHRPASADDLPVTILIVAVIVFVTAGVLFRPGSAINRRSRR